MNEEDIPCCRKKFLHAALPPTYVKVGTLIQSIGKESKGWVEKRERERERDELSSWQVALYSNCPL
jgi:hypothetical protein